MPVRAPRTPDPVPTPRIADPDPSSEFCRALYDYQSTDMSCLSFRQHDVIHVLNKVETGWWDGILGDARGWFPSNYVTIISAEEAAAQQS
ncbi:hypothetical protein HWV62_44083 [Athelia sp. TMB]|nr:hypothetical protein HWV62_44083 [Athelia sp. TMB]